MVAAPEGGRKWHFFVAHAAADARAAGRLADLLVAGAATVFLDTQNLRLGDIWPRVLAEAQENADVTVILVSQHTSSAYYQLEELAKAIEIARRPDRSHRVVPIYLEPVENIPYGLRITHAHDAFDDQALTEAAVRLLGLLRRRPDDAATIWGSRIPRVGSYFAGRDVVLAGLATELKSRGSLDIRTVAGPHGVGKSTVAAALCAKQADAYEIVWWARGDTADSLIDDLAELGEELGTHPGDKDRKTQAEAACLALEREERRWLLVIDNVEDIQLVRQFAPRRGNGRMIVTTMRRDFRPLGPVVDLGPFDAHTAGKFLQERVEPSNPVAAKEAAVADVAARLRGLPLALEHAGAYVAYSPLRSFSKYLVSFDDAKRYHFTAGRPSEYDATATTSQVSIDAAGPHAPKILAVFGAMADAPVPLACFTHPGLARHPYLGASADDIVATIEELYNYSLLDIYTNNENPDTKSLRVHVLVQAAASRTHNTAAAYYAVDALRLLHPDNVERPESWSVCAELRPHVLKIAADPDTVVAAEDEPRAIKISWLLERAGTALRYAGAAAQAIPLLQQALAIREAVYGLNSPEAAWALTRLGFLLWDMAGFENATRAKKLFERAVTIFQMADGNDHPNVAIALTGVGQADLDLDDATSAIACQRRALAIFKKAFAKEPSRDLEMEIARALDKLGYAVGYQGDAASAVALHTEALGMFTSMLGGAAHLEMGWPLSNLALALAERGDLNESRQFQEQARDVFLAAFGPDHPSTQIVLLRLADLDHRPRSDQWRWRPDTSL